MAHLLHGGGCRGMSRGRTLCSACSPTTGGNNSGYVSTSGPDCKTGSRAPMCARPPTRQPPPPPSDTKLANIFIIPGVPKGHDGLGILGTSRCLLGWISPECQRHHPSAQRRSSNCGEVSHVCAFKLRRGAGGCHTSRYFHPCATRANVGLRAVNGVVAIPLRPAPAGSRPGG